MSGSLGGVDPALPESPTHLLKATLPESHASTRTGSHAHRRLMDGGTSWFAMQQNSPRPFYNVTLATAADEALDRSARAVVEPSCYCNTLRAQLHVGDAPIGSVTGKLLLGNIAESDGVSIVDLADALSDPLFEFVEATFCRRSNTWNEVYWELLEPNGSDLLYLEQLEIDQQYRGRGLGLLLLQVVLRRCPHSVAIMRPFPLQFPALTASPALGGKPPLPVEARPARSLAVLQKLVRDRMNARRDAYYGRIGFMPVAPAPYLARSTSFANNYLHPEKVFARDTH